MSDDEFHSKLKELTEFRYETNIGTRKNPKMLSRSLYVITFNSEMENGDRIQTIAISHTRPH